MQAKQMLYHGPSAPPQVAVLIRKNSIARDREAKIIVQIRRALLSKGVSIKGTSLQNKFSKHLDVGVSYVAP